MNWRWLRCCPGLDTRGRFISRVVANGRVLDLGSSDGETLRHFAELRPDLHLFAVDTEGRPENYPAGCQFHRADLVRDALPWPDSSMDAITCMHLVEHLLDLSLLLREVARLLKPGAPVYFETPHPRSLSLTSPRGKAAGTFTLNFYDDPTHVRVVPVDELAQRVQQAGLHATDTGISRNWLFAAAHPFFRFLPPSRKKFTAQIHWIGWSAYLIARRPQ